MKISTNIYLQAITGLLLSLALFMPAVAATTPLTLTWVSVDKSSFNPRKGEKLTLRYRVSKAATVSVEFKDPLGNIVHRLKQEVAADNHKMIWNGKTRKGRYVKPEAYVYRLLARTGNEQVVYDLSQQTGGETIWPRNTALEENGDISYSLPRAARVRLFVSSEAQYWPVLDLLDWQARPQGTNKEHWDGWDKRHVVKPLGRQKLIPILYAYALPQNSVIVEGKTKKQALVKARPATTTEPVYSSKRPAKSLHFHARHAPTLCYSPVIQAKFPRSVKKNKQGVARINKPTPVSLSISSRQPKGKARPIPRVSVFVYVDGVLKEKMLAAYTPYQWIADPREIGPGEHVISSLFTWKDDHFGIVHTKIHVESAKGN